MHDQVCREPGQKEIHRARVGKLADINADELTMAKQFFELDHGNLFRRTGLFRLSPTLTDVVEFGLIDAWQSFGSR